MSQASQIMPELDAPWSLQSHQSPQQSRSSYHSNDRSSGVNVDSSLHRLDDVNERGVGNAFDSLRIDRSASLDAEPTTRTAVAVAVAVANDDYLAPNEHRRIASTGNDRQELSSSTLGVVPQLASQPQSIGFNGGEENELVLEAAIADLDSDIIFHGGISALHDAARITDWRSVAAISVSNPESAKYVGPDGWNALHHACDRRCPYVDVIDALLTAYPEAIVQTNDKGWTPLHRACRNKTPKDVVKLLLRKYPELGKRAAAMRCNDGRSSLHYALLYDAPEGVVELLLEADPGAVLDEDRDCVSPLGTVWDRYANSFEGKRMLHTLLRPFEGEGWELGIGRLPNTNNHVNHDIAYDSDNIIHSRSGKEVAEMKVREAMVKPAPMFKTLQSNWKLTHTLLKAYFHFPIQDLKNINDHDAITTGLESLVPKKRKWRILHATSAIKCHPTMFTLARALHPEEASEFDANDLFGTGNNTQISINEPNLYELSNRTALHFATMSPLSGREGRNVIKVLLKLNPLAASHLDSYGSLPLHLICQNGRKQHWTNCGAQDIYNAFPDATIIRDSFGRTPLHCAVSSVGHLTQNSPARVSQLQARSIVGVPTENIVPPAAGVQAEAVSDESLIQKLVEANNIAASMPDNSGRLPLHYVAEGLEEWTSDAQSIFDAYPAAVQTRANSSTHNQLPLHMVASSPDARPSLIMNILNSNPRAASLFDSMGRLPLHLAVDAGRTTWDQGMEIIYMAYTPALITPEESPRKWTVLHTAAASRSAGCELIESILRLAGNLATVPDSDGRYPLHLACAANRSWKEGGIQSIFDADPSAALLEDSNGLLPFHIAALGSVTSNNSNGTLEDVVKLGTNKDDLASLEVLFNLLTSQPSILHR